VPFTLVHTGK